MKGLNVDYQKDNYPERYQLWVWKNGQWIDRGVVNDSATLLLIVRYLKESAFYVMALPNK